MSRSLEFFFTHTSPPAIAIELIICVCGEHISNSQLALDCKWHLIDWLAIWLLCFAGMVRRALFVICRFVCTCRVRHWETWLLVHQSTQAATAALLHHFDENGTLTGAVVDARIDGMGGGRPVGE